MAEPSTRIDALFNETRSVCAGRFTIDIPATAQVVYGRADIPLQVIRHAGQAKHLEKLLDNSAKNLENDRYLAMRELRGTQNDLGKVIDGVVKGQKTFVGLSPVVGDHYALNSFVPVGDDVFELEGNDLVTPKDYAADIAALNETAVRIIPRLTDLPTEPGFCIDSALVKDAGKQMVERIHLGVRLAEFPDVHFSLALVMKDRKVDSDALEPRFQEAEQAVIRAGLQAWHKRIKFLRRGKRELKPWIGDEILMHVPAKDRDTDAHQFIFVAMGEPKNVHVPTVDMTLDTGVENNHRGGTPPSITDDEALYLWDRLLNSLKVRPTK